jgi:BolA protein
MMIPMHVHEQLEDRLQREFCPSHLVVLDDSAKHAGHAGAPDGGDSHFTVIIVSKAFDGLERLSRHRAVHGVLEDLFDATTLHALRLKIYTPTEWMGKKTC